MVQLLKKKDNAHLIYNAKNGEKVFINSPGIISAKSITPVDK